jgi:hypothetical protein
MNTGTNPAHPAPEADRHHRLHLLAVVVAIAVLLWTLGAEDTRGWLWPEPVSIRIDERAYLVPERELKRLSRTRPDWLSEGEARALDRLEQGVRRELDHLFEPVHGRVPEFADWYYSMTGATLRLLATVPNPFWRNRTEFLARALGQRLFPEEAWQAELEAFERSVAALYSLEISTLEREWLDWLARELAPYGRDRLPPSDEPPMDINRRLQAHMAEVLDTNPIGVRLPPGLGAGAGAVLATGAITRVSARAASARAAARLASRGTAGAGAAACGLTGPLAIGCGLVVFTSVTLGAEWALLKTDEILNRDELESAMHASLAALRDSMTDEYGLRLLGAFESDMGALSEGVRRSVRPIDRLRPTAP